MTLSPWRDTFQVSMERPMLRHGGIFFKTCFGLCSPRNKNTEPLGTTCSAQKVYSLDCREPPRAIQEGYLKEEGRPAGNEVPWILQLQPSWIFSS